MKYFKSALIFSLLVLVPLGSWYYLKKGLDYRKDAMVKLSGDTSISEICKTAEVYRGETVLLAHVNNAPNYKEELSRLMSEFDDVPKFMCLIIKDTFIDNSKEDFSNQFRFQSHKEACNYAYADLSLIDTAGVIRRTYTADELGYIEVIEHLAIILPSPEERDIKIKSYESK